VVFNGVRIARLQIFFALRYERFNYTIPVNIEIDPQQMETVGPRPKSFEKNLTPLIDHGFRARLELESIVIGKLQVSSVLIPIGLQKRLPRNSRGSRRDPMTSPN